MNEGSPISAYDSIVVEGDFISEHYLAEEFGARVRALRKDWIEREHNDQRTPRQELAALSSGVRCTAKTTTRPSRRP